MMKKILVTGGAGFLGSHLCEKLLEKGYDIICADNLFTGSKENISHLFDNPYFEFLRHDITIPLFVEVDEIYNLACPASPVHYQYDPVQTTKTSVHGSINMLGLAKRTESKILLASTIKELAIMIRKVVKYEGELVFNKKYPDGTPRKLLNTSRLNAMGWYSNIKLENGLISVYEWYLDKLPLS